jgi:indoleamine 2,3-dioxygenase
MSKVKLKVLPASSQGRGRGISFETGDTMTRCDLEMFGLAEGRGFLPVTDPLVALPQSEFAAWEYLGQHLPKYVAALSVRKAVLTLPEFRTELLSCDAELKRAMVLLSFIAHAYVFGERAIADRIPAIIARPWYEVAKKLGRPPVLSYESYVLDNWQRLDPQGPIAIGNIALVQNFGGGLDEEWFSIVHIACEAQAASALSSLARGRGAILDNNAEELVMALHEISRATGELSSVLARLAEFCDPEIFARRVAPYLCGWHSNPTMPNGLVYEGVAEYGGVAQSFLSDIGLQGGAEMSVCGFLGIEVQDETIKALLAEVRSDMSPQHRWFLEAAEAAPSTREFVATHTQCAGLREAFNECVEQVERLRAQHRELLRDYGLGVSTDVQPIIESPLATAG